MNRKDLKKYFRNLIESTEKELNKRSILSESDDKPPLVSPNLKRISQMLANRPDSYEDEDPAYASQFGSHLSDDEYEEYEEYEDVQALADFDALNDDKDETLYRDNPDYRRAYDIMANNPVPDAPSPPKYNTSLRRALFGSEYPNEDNEGGRPHLDYGSLEAEEDALDALRNPSYDDDEDSEWEFSEEYKKMIDTFSPYDKEGRTPDTGGDPFEDHPDNEQGSYKRRF